MKNHSNDSNRDSFHFSRKNVVDGERLLALQSASGLDAVSGRSIGSRTECVTPRIWLHGRRRIVVFYWVYKQKYCAKCTVFSLVFPLISHIRVTRYEDYPPEYHASTDMAWELQQAVVDLPGIDWITCICMWVNVHSCAGLHSVAKNW